MKKLCSSTTFSSTTFPLRFMIFFSHSLSNHFFSVTLHLRVGPCGAFCIQIVMEMGVAVVQVWDFRVQRLSHIEDTTLQQTFYHHCMIFSEPLMQGFWYRYITENWVCQTIIIHSLSFLVYYIFSIYIFLLLSISSRCKNEFYYLFYFYWLKSQCKQVL